MLNRNSEAGYKVAYAIVVAAVLGIFCVAQLLEGNEAQKLFIKEGGIVETLSALGYIVCAILLASKGGIEYMRKHWYFFVVLLACAAREFDFDKRFTEVGIFKSKFLVSPEVGIPVKIIGLAVVLFLLFTLVKILRKYAVDFLKKLPSVTIFELSIVTAGVFLVVAKTLDGLSRKLLGIIEVSPEVNAIATNMEEAMEFGVPCLFAIAILVYFARLQRAAE